MNGAIRLANMYKAWLFVSAKVSEQRGARERAREREKRMNVICVNMLLCSVIKWKTNKNMAQKKDVRRIYDKSNGINSQGGAAQFETIG